MGMTVLDVPGLLSRLQGSKVYFDTNVFIYVLNNTPVLAPPCVQLLDACAAGQIIGLTGELTLAELLVKPFQAHDVAAIAAVRDLLIDDGAISLVGHDRVAFERAALYRARYGLKLPDALQLATAQQAGAVCLISNDRKFPTLPDIESVSLSG
jgi:predicted nucleic acid-binding protein